MTHAIPILDYSQFVEDFASESAPELEMQYNRTKPKKPTLFYAARGRCPFCGISARLAHRDSITDVHESWAYGFDASVQVWECSICGWWEIMHHNSIWSDSDIGRQTRDTLRHGILRSFFSDDPQLPVDLLRRKIKSHPNVLLSINTRKMEELAHSVFSDFYQCDVIHCGRTDDGGIDLLVVDSDKPIAVQVKRRTRPDAVETVSLVREFLGAMMLDSRSRGAIVSTAGHFSKGAREAARRAIARGHVTEFNLYDIKSFLDMFQLINTKEETSWREHLPQLPHPYGAHAAHDVAE